MAADEVKYDRHYRESAAACGEPFNEFVAFASEHGRAGVEVLDLGCGQGRDALMFGRRGCRVLGVDISAVGIQQLNQIADQESMDVRGVVGDLRAFEPGSTYDVVILDRVLHMLRSDGERSGVLSIAVTATRPGGVVLVADGPKHRTLIRGYFAGLGWEFVKDTKNHTFARRPGGRGPANARRGA